jgi:hypothetical protein
MAKQKVTATEGILVHLEPEAILAEDNARYGMRDVGVVALKESILKSGGVMEPVEVEILETPANGFTHKLTFGFKRHAAVSELNKEGAGLKLPCLLHKNADPIERTKRQVEENLQRESLSIMDQAVAMKRLLDAGLSKPEVREVFRRPGGRKGNKTQPISNAYLNMLVSFLDFPKKIQNRIHNDEIGVAAAYELRKSAPDKWEAILDRIENDAVKLAETEEKEEKRFLDGEKKIEVAKSKETEANTALETAKGALTAVQGRLNQWTEEANRLYKVAQGKFADKEQKKVAEQAFAKAEQERKVAAADAHKVEEEVATFESKAKKAAEVAQERLDKLAAARKGKSAVGPGEVKKAAQAVAEGGPVPLNGAYMRKVAEELCLPGGVQGVIEIGKALRECFAGIITNKQLYKRLAEIVS